MEIDAGAPYYRAKVVAKPVQRVDGTVIVKVEYCERQGRTIARFYSNKDKAMELSVDNIIYVCPYDGDAYLESESYDSLKKKH